MKKVIAGILICILFSAVAEMALAAFPTFTATEEWSSDLMPDPDFLSASDSFITDKEVLDEIGEETPDEVLGEIEEVQVTTPTDMEIEVTDVAMEEKKQKL